MKIKNFSGTYGKVWEKISKYKFVLIVLLAGLVLLLIPTGTSSGEKTAVTDSTVKEDFSLKDQESRIASALSKIEGAGSVTVVLTLKGSTEQIIASDETSSDSTGGNNNAESKTENSKTAVIISKGSSNESPVTLKYIYPEYLGALVVSQGAGNPTVKLQLIEAVSGLTGLGTDKVTVTKMKNS